jgi:hypothetical protein
MVRCVWGSPGLECYRGPSPWHWQCALEGRLFTRVLIRPLVRAYRAACLAYIRFRKQFMFTNTCLQFGWHLISILVSSDFWDGWTVPYFTTLFRLERLSMWLYSVRLKDCRRKWSCDISQHCSGILLDELRKTFNISVRFSYKPRKTTKIAARSVTWLQSIEVLLLGLTSRFSNWRDENCTQNCSREAGREENLKLVRISERCSG